MKNETITFYKSWTQNVVYILSLDKNFLSHFWRPQGKNKLPPTLEDEKIPEKWCHTATQKSVHLDLILRQIPNFTLHLKELHTKALYSPEKWPEVLFQCLVAFFKDDLLAVNGGLIHHGDEDLSPSLENTNWSTLVYHLLVKQKYGSELCNNNY